jgi:hypothetical protein
LNGPACIVDVREETSAQESLFGSKKRVFLDDVALSICSTSFTLYIPQRLESSANG